MTRDIKGAHADERGVTSLAYDPAGRVLVSSGIGEVKAWDAESGKPIGTAPAKRRGDDPKVRIGTVTATHVLTSDPLALFEFRF